MFTKTFWTIKRVINVICFLVCQVARRLPILKASKNLLGKTHNHFSKFSDLQFLNGSEKMIVYLTKNDRKWWKIEMSRKTDKVEQVQLIYRFLQRKFLFIFRHYYLKLFPVEKVYFWINLSKTETAHYTLVSNIDSRTVIRTELELFLELF